MRYVFEWLPYQWAATTAACGVFEGQPRRSAARFLAPGPAAAPGELPLPTVAFGNAPLELSEATLLENLRREQRAHGLPLSERLWAGPGRACAVNLDVEMETGTGKTYVYAQTAYELHRRYGWSKFIVMVPSVAIREGVKAALEATADHFCATYGHRAEVDVYDSKRVTTVSDFSADGKLRFLIMNTQAFAARKDTLKIKQQLDALQSQVPLKVLAAARPILILDEPQKMEGKQTESSLKAFCPLFILRYSATHRTRHDLVYRLDAVDAFNQKLVKRISVVGLRERGAMGSGAYLHLAGVEARPEGGPVARLELELRTAGGGVRRTFRTVRRGDDLYALSGGMAQYQAGYDVREVAATDEGGRVRFGNGLTLEAGDLVGHTAREAVRETLFRETIRAHLRTERRNFPKGVKTLSLFFLDHVAAYRDYARPDAKGVDAHLFERVYREEVAATLEDLYLPADYRAYLEAIDAEATHEGYFSIDKKSGRAVETSEAAGAKDVDAYDLILRDKASLLALPRPDDSEERRRRANVRFLFSHSALREGWDNPNVFTLCLLRKTDDTIGRRQEVGRGLRLCVTQSGKRWQGADPHDLNRLTVITSEECKGFVAALQKEIADGLSSRPPAVGESTFRGMEVRTGAGLFRLDAEQSKGLYWWLRNAAYVDDEGAFTKEWHADRTASDLPPLPRTLEPAREPVLEALDRLAAGRKVTIDNGRGLSRIAPNRANLGRKEFRELWRRLHRKCAYRIAIDTERLIEACVAALNSTETGPRVPAPVVTVEEATLRGNVSAEALRGGTAFAQGAHRTEVIAARFGDAVAYDLVGELAAPERTGLTRRTVAAILRQMEPSVKELYPRNPEPFINEVAAIINREKVRQVVEHIAYEPLRETYGLDLFTEGGPVMLQSEQTEECRLAKHLYPFVATDSKVEQRFACDLDRADEVAVFVKLPAAFAIPEGAVQHLYFVAETKGSDLPEDLREREHQKIECAKAYFRTLRTQLPQNAIHYDVVTGADRLFANLLRLSNAIPRP